MPYKDKEKQRLATLQSLRRRALRLKLRCVEYKGGSCRCGYNKCLAALDFHHRKGEVKSFGLSSIKLASIVRTWEHIKQELDKCDLLCSNCHREEHYQY